MLRVVGGSGCHGVAAKKIGVGKFPAPPSEFGQNHCYSRMYCAKAQRIVFNRYPSIDTACPRPKAEADVSC